MGSFVLSTMEDTEDSQVRRRTSLKQNIIVNCYISSELLIPVASHVVICMAVNMNFCYLYGREYKLLLFVCLNINC